VKRTLILVLLITVIASAGAFAASGFGIGGAFTLRFLRDDGVYPGGIATLGPPGVPFMFGAGLSVVQGRIIPSITVDWWVYQGRLAPALGIYLGPGLFLFLDDPVQLGLRFPVALQIFPVKSLEIFIEVSPNLGVGIADPVTFPEFVLLSAIGARYWF
jgi:hypothetical protein